MPQQHKAQRHSKRLTNLADNRAWRREDTRVRQPIDNPNRAARRALKREAYALAQMQASQEHAQVQDQVQPS